MAGKGKGLAFLGLGIGALLLFGRKASGAVREATDMQLSPHFRLSEFLRSTAVPALKYYKPTEEEIITLKALCTGLLEPLRKHVGRPIFISGGIRPESVRDPKGRTFDEALKAAGYDPAKHSDHKTANGVDFEIVQGTKAQYEAAYKFLESNPLTRQVILYYIKNIPNHIHLSIVIPGKPKITSDSYAFLNVDGKKLETANV